MLRLMLRSRARQNIHPGRRSRAALRLEPLEERSLPSITVVSGFDGLDFNSSQCNCVPPDTIAAVGSSHVIETPNSAITITDKSGNPVGGYPKSFASFFAPVSPGPNSNLFDPQVYYDEGSGRFIVGVDDVDFTHHTSNYLLAVSDSGSETTFTHEYKFSTKETIHHAGYWADFPRLGYNADAVTVTFNMFSFSSGFFAQVQMVNINKSNLESGTLTKFVHNFSGSSNFTMVPAKTHGSVAGDPVWVVEENGYENGSSIRVDKITNELSLSPTVTSYNITVPSYGVPPAANSEGGVLMDTDDSRILSVALRSGRLLATQNIGNSSGVANAAWYEFNVSGTPSLTQSGTINPGSGVATYYPSIDINSAGSLGMTYMESSSSEFVSMYVTGQAPGGSGMQTGVVAQAGQVQYSAFDGSPHRAGDFSGITVDPSDGSFWAANEYAKNISNLANTKWGTHITNFTVTATPSWTQPAAAVASPAVTGAPVDRTTLTPVPALNPFVVLTTLPTPANPSVAPAAPANTGSGLPLLDPARVDQVFTSITTADPEPQTTAPSPLTRRLADLRMADGWQLISRPWESWLDTLPRH